MNIENTTERIEVKPLTGPQIERIRKGLSGSITQRADAYKVALTPAVLKVDPAKRRAAYVQVWTDAFPDDKDSFAVTAYGLAILRHAEWAAPIWESDHLSASSAMSNLNAYAQLMTSVSHKLHTERQGFAGWVGENLNLPSGSGEGSFVQALRKLRADSGEEIKPPKASPETTEQKVAKAVKAEAAKAKTKVKAAVAKVKAQPIDEYVKGWAMEIRQRNSETELPTEAQLRDAIETLEFMVDHLATINRDRQVAA